MTIELARPEELPGSAKVEALFEVIALLAKNITNYNAKAKKDLMKSLQGNIPKELPSRLRGILRNGIAQVCRATSEKQALYALKVTQNDYYAMETVVRAAIQSLNRNVS